MTEVDLEIEYRPVSKSDAAIVLDYLMPFMKQGFLLEREIDEIRKLTEYGFAAFHEDRIVGFAAVEIYSRKLAELQCLAVSPEYRRLGIGRSLVQWCCETARNVGVRELMAISASDEMFLACGFDYSLPKQKRALFFKAD